MVWLDLQFSMTLFCRVLAFLLDSRKRNKKVNWKHTNKITQWELCRLQRHLTVGFCSDTRMSDASKTCRFAAIQKKEEAAIMVSSLLITLQLSSQLMLLFFRQNLLKTKTIKKLSSAMNDRISEENHAGKCGKVWRSSRSSRKRKIIKTKSKSVASAQPKIVSLCCALVSLPCELETLLIRTFELSAMKLDQCDSVDGCNKNNEMTFSSMSVQSRRRFAINNRPKTADKFLVSSRD